MAVNRHQPNFSVRLNIFESTPRVRLPGDARQSLRSSWLTVASVVHCEMSAGRTDSWSSWG